MKERIENMSGALSLLVLVVLILGLIWPGRLAIGAALCIFLMIIALGWVGGEE